MTEQVTEPTVSPEMTGLSAMMSGLEGIQSSSNLYIIERTVGAAYQYETILDNS